MLLNDLLRISSCKMNDDVDEVMVSNFNERSFGKGSEDGGGNEEKG